MKTPPRDAPPLATRPRRSVRSSDRAMDAPIPLLQLERVTKIYRMGEVEVAALRGISLSIDRGEFVALMGASGSGKSTLMNILGCLDRPTSGTYRFDGTDVSRLNRNELADVRNLRLGFVFQTFNLLHRTTASENVELPLIYSGVGTQERQARAKQALERVGLGDRLRHHPNQMSGRQQQRVAIARALVMKDGLIREDQRQQPASAIPEALEEALA